MNEQDEKLLQLYLQYVRKRRIICIIVIIFFSIGISLFGYVKYKQSTNQINSITQEEINGVNETITNEITNNEVENIIIEQKQEEQKQVEEKAKEENNEESINKESKVEQTKQETPSDNKQVTKQKENKTTPQKPSNKDFLFTDGYTMDNVTQAAQDYLKSYSYSGECVPIKDNEGIYLGMRVIFY